MANENIVLPVDHFKRRVKHQYTNVPLAIVREVLQNSQDAGASQVEFTLSENELIAVDNGKGMTLDDFRSFYLILGGSKKETGSIGGFGAAKELLSFAWDNWTCKGQGFVVNGHGADSPQSRQDDSLKEGFAVAAHDEEIDSERIAQQARFITGLSSLTLTVSVNGEKLGKGRKLRASQVFKEYDFGTLYVHKSTPNANESTGYLYIRSKGLYTCAEFVGGDYVYYLELSAASPEVLTESRDNLRWKIKQTIQKDLQSALSSGSIEEKPTPKIKVFGESFEAKRGYTEELGEFEIEGVGTFEQEFTNAIETGKVDSWVVQDVASRYAGEEVGTYVAELAEVTREVGFSTPTTEQQEAIAHVVREIAQVNPEALSQIASVAHLPTTQNEYAHAPKETTISQTWRKAYAVVDSTGKAPDVTKDDTIRPKYAKALEVWTRTLNLVADVSGLTRPIPGLLFDDKFDGLCAEGENDKFVVAGGVTSILEDSPYAVLDLAIHELAHYERSNHSQEYESVRSGIARSVGQNAPAILDTITRLQQEPARRGRYWEN